MDIKEIKSGLTKDNFWHSAKNSLIRVLLSKLKKKKLKILDIGAGDGSDIEILKNFGDVTVIDISKETLALIPNKIKIKKKLGDATNLPFKKGLFDLVVAFDVLEHIKKDTKAIAEIDRVLKREGYFIFTVPAYNWMYSSYDKLLSHFRRYSKKEIKKKLRHLKPLYLSYWNSFLFIPMMIERLIKKKKRHISYKNTFNPLTNKLGYHILTFENFLIKMGLKFKFGGTICGVYKKIKI